MCPLIPVVKASLPDAKSIDLFGNPVCSVSCDGACGVGWLISPFSIRFEDTAINATKA